MMSSLLRWVAAAVAVSVLAPVGPAWAAAPPSPASPRRRIGADEALKQVRAYLTRLRAREAQVVPMNDEAVTRSFPDRFLIAVWFRSYPVAMVAPRPLKQQNLFVVERTGRMTRFSDRVSLEKLFLFELPRAGDNRAMRDAVRAWLLLSTQLLQDGFYRFSIPEESISIQTGEEGSTATGKALVAAGGTGELGVTMELNAAGKLLDVSESGKVQPGVRPICQATKLLDRDPVVRRMAEQDILVMGRAAEPYLREQRARARPALRGAIDRIRKRIVSEGR